ncbi:MAG: dicarboxylate/amino acid:cation symporter [Myxococcaceae bacterium]
MSETDPKQTERGPRFPLYAQVLLGVAVGIGLGAAFGLRPILFGAGNEDLGALGMLVICLANVAVALALVLALMNVLRPGERWRSQMDSLVGAVGQPAAVATPQGASLSPLKNLQGFIPESLVDPFLRNNMVSVVLLAILVGAALRRVRQGPAAEGVRTLERLIEVGYLTLVQTLSWVVKAVPFALCGIIAHVVGRSGLAVFGPLWIFLGVILAGMALHSLLYYPLVAWVVGGVSPRRFFGQGADAILTGFSTNSSLATVPVTLRCLTGKMGVSDESARLSACIGTNLNNDGITLYEATAALFMAQACGMNLSLGQQAAVLLAALASAVGVAGIPEAGLIVLPLVLAAAGIPTEMVVLLLPLVVPVDWILARCRSAVNVMSDMVVAIMLDGRSRPLAAEGLAAAATPLSQHSPGASG